MVVVSPPSGIVLWVELSFCDTEDWVIPVDDVLTEGDVEGVEKLLL